MDRSFIPVLITRPAPFGADFAGLLRGAGFGGEVVLSPLMRIAPTGVTPDFAGIEGVIFTSVQGVARVKGGALVAWCVGSATAQAAGEQGWLARDCGGDADQLVDTIQREKPDGPLLHIRGEVARGDVARRLSAGGITTNEAIVYRQDAQSLSTQAQALLDQDITVVVPLFSPRSAEILRQQGPFRANLRIVAMSDAVAQAAQSIAQTCQIAPHPPTAKGMAQLTSQAAKP